MWFNVGHPEGLKGFQRETNPGRISPLDSDGKWAKEHDARWGLVSMFGPAVQALRRVAIPIAHPK